jgi:hypothetical protein
MWPSWCIAKAGRVDGVIPPCGTNTGNSNGEDDISGICIALFDIDQHDVPKGKMASFIKMPAT